MDSRVVQGYDNLPDSWIERSEGLSSRDIYAPVANFFPAAPVTVLDVGAGAGRDAAWLAGLGYHVTAVEPSGRLLEAGRTRHEGLPIRWVQDSLPALASLGSGSGFELVISNGVLHHLTGQAQQQAILRLGQTCMPSGRIVLSLRHGPGPADRPTFPIDTEALIETGISAGLTVLNRQERGSLQPENQALGVIWTWLVMERI